MKSETQDLQGRLNSSLFTLRFSLTLQAVAYVHEQRI